MAISLYLGDQLKKLFAMDDPSGESQMLLINSNNTIILAEDDERIGEQINREIDIGRLTDGESSLIHVKPREAL